MRWLRHWRSDPSVALGVKDLTPAAIALTAWGLVTGVAMVKSGLSVGQAFAMSLMVYAGSAQLASLPLLAAGAPLPIIWASALIINLRFVIYSVAFKPFFRGLSLARRVACASAAVDAMAAEFFHRFTDAREASPRIEGQPIRPMVYFVSGSAMAWLAWQVSSIAGIFLAASIPSHWGLEFVATLALIAMVTPMVNDRASLACVVVAAVVGLATYGLTLNLGLLISVIAGVAAAMLFDAPPKEQK